MNYAGLVGFSPASLRHSVVIVPIILFVPNDPNLSGSASIPDKKKLRRFSSPLKLPTKFCPSQVSAVQTAAKNVNLSREGSHRH